MLAVALVVVVVAAAAVVSALYFYTSAPVTTSMTTTSASQVSSSVSSTSTGTGPLLLFIADAYTAEGQSLLQAYSTQTGVVVAPPKSAGSTVLAQQIAQGAPVSVFISVSKPAVQATYLKNQSSGWAIGFASDQMTIAYSNATLQNAAGSAVVNDFSKATASNSSADWTAFFNALSSGNVKVGISNPNADPAGYRGWLVLEAAGGAYANSSTYFSDQMLANSGNVTASAAANLVAPLQAGEIQFLFIYRSAAVAQKLHFLQLPDAINLGSPVKASFYSKFTYRLTTGVQKGSPIVLYVAIPKDSTDQTDALSFVSFLLHNDQTVLGGYELNVFSRATLYNDTVVPSQISQLLGTSLLGEGGSL
jgi:molybdate/tungstate transport system substrate-binding protein